MSARARSSARPWNDEQRLSSRLALDGDLLEGEAAPAGAEGLHRGFLRGEAAGHVLGERARMAPPAIDLARLEDAREEPLAVPLEDAGHALDFREVDPDQDAHQASEKSGDAGRERERLRDRGLRGSRVRRGIGPGGGQRQAEAAEQPHGADRGGQNGDGAEDPLAGREIVCARAINGVRSCRRRRGVSGVLKEPDARHAGDPVAVGLQPIEHLLRRCRRSRGPPHECARGVRKVPPATSGVSGGPKARLRRRLEDRAEEDQVGPVGDGGARLLGGMRRDADAEAPRRVGAHPRDRHPVGGQVHAVGTSRQRHVEAPVHVEGDVAGRATGGSAAPSRAPRGRESPSRGAGPRGPARRERADRTARSRSSPAAARSVT